MQFDLRNRLIENLEFYKPEVLYCKRKGIIIRVRIAKRCEEFGGARRHPLAFRGSQYHQVLHSVASVKAAALDVHRKVVLDQQVKIKLNAFAIPCSRRSGERTRAQSLINATTWYMRRLSQENCSER